MCMKYWPEIQRPFFKLLNCQTLLICDALSVWVAIKEPDLKLWRILDNVDPGSYRHAELNHDLFWDFQRELTISVLIA